LAIEAGLLYGGGDPDWLDTLPRAKRRKVLRYLFARQTRTGAMWSATFRPSDIAHILGGGDGAADGAAGTEADPLMGMLRALESPG